MTSNYETQQRNQPAEITWSASNHSSYLNGSRRATSLLAAVRASRVYWRYELYGEGVITIYANGEPIREDRNDLSTGHRWVTVQL